MTSTYDHRVIQGAESGSFLRRIDQLLQGEDSFYESVAESLGLAAAVVTTAYPASASAAPTSTPAGVTAAAPPDTELLQAVQAAASLLKAYRTHGHLAARLDPLGKTTGNQQARHDVVEEWTGEVPQHQRHLRPARRAVDRSLGDLR